MDYEHTRERPVSQGDSIWFAVMGVKAQLTDAYKPRDPCDILVERLGGRTPQRPAGMPMELYSMIEKCLQIECTKRPKITDLKVVLATLEGNSQTPMMDFHERLVAYVVPDAVVVQDVTDTCRAVLPGYMVPSSVAGLACWPLTASGKINRALLPPASNILTRAVSTGEVVSLQGETEMLVAEVCAAVLAVDIQQLGRSTNLMEVGLNSLRAVVLHRALQKRELHGIKSVVSVLTYPTIAELAAMVQTNDNSMGQLRHKQQMEGVLPVTLFHLSYDSYVWLLQS